MSNHIINRGHTDDQQSPLQENHLYTDLLLHIPHSSTRLPSSDPSDLSQFDDEELKLIDYDTDRLFMPAGKGPHPHIHSIVFPWCRLYCDVERLIHDPLAAQGLGVSYFRRMPDGTVRSWGDPNDAYRLYVDYHARVTRQLIDLCSSGRVLLIDCHSFSAQPTLLCPHPTTDVDICIGFNDDATRPSDAVLEAIRDHFTSRRYHVSLNTPFACSKTFDMPDGNRYHSVMIELNKRIYLNEDSRIPHIRYPFVRRDIQALYAKLLQPQP